MLTVMGCPFLASLQFVAYWLDPLLFFELPFFLLVSFTTVQVGQSVKQVSLSTSSFIPKQLCLILSLQFKDETHKC